MEWCHQLRVMRPSIVGHPNHRPPYTLPGRASPGQGLLGGEEVTDDDDVKGVDDENHTSPPVR